MAPYTLPQNAVWFITGCSSGIGLALATRLSSSAKPSTRVVATARNPSSLSSLPSTPNVLKLALDVTSEDSIQAALKATLDAFGRIDVLVNNAGYNILSEAELVKPEQAEHLMRTNFWGPQRLIQLLLPIFRSRNSSTGQKGGVVLNITSIGGRLAFAGNSYYHASKFALEGFTEAVAKEVDEGWNVHFCCIEPGGVATSYAHTSVAPKDVSSSSERKEDGGEKEKGKDDGVSEEARQAYADPNSQTNMLRAFHVDPRAEANWVNADNVAKAIAGVVEGGDIPLRVPLGADSWGLQRKGLRVALERLENEETRARAFSVCTEELGERQMAGIEFLKL